MLSITAKLAFILNRTCPVSIVLFSSPSSSLLSLLALVCHTQLEPFLDNVAGTCLGPLLISMPPLICHHPVRDLL